MICDSCGYNNQPNAVTCVRCGQPLPVGETSPVNKVPNYKRPGQASGSKVTTMQPIAELPIADPKSTILQIPAQSPVEEQCEIPLYASSFNPKETVCQKITICPQCQYPIIGDIEKCPKCGTVLREEKKTQTPSKADLYSSKGETTKEKTIFRPFNKTPKADPDPTEEKKIPTCRLSIVKEADEIIDDIINNYEGEEIELRRDNTEPSNLTITSKVQAKLTYEDGHWYIENCSDMQTTYIQVKRRIEVMPNDTIILGNRSFTFGVDDK